AYCLKTVSKGEYGASQLGVFSLDEDPSKDDSQVSEIEIKNATFKSPLVLHGYRINVLYTTSRLSYLVIAGHPVGDDRTFIQAIPLVDAPGEASEKSESHGLP